MSTLRRRKPQSNGRMHDLGVHMGPEAVARSLAIAEEIAVFHARVKHVHRHRVRHVTRVVRSS